MMLVLNALSAALAWVVQYRSLNGWASLLIGIFAVGNAVLGSWFIWRLLRDEPPSDQAN